MQTVEMSFLLHGLLREDVIAPFLAGADDGVEVGAYYLTRYFGPIEAQLTVKSTLTQKGPEPTPPPPPRSLRTVAEILEAVS